MTEETKTMDPDNPGVLTVDIDGTEHQYRVNADETVTFSWEPDEE